MSRRWARSPTLPRSRRRSRCSGPRCRARRTPAPNQRSRGSCSRLRSTRRSTRRPRRRTSPSTLLPQLCAMQGRNRARSAGDLGDLQVYACGCTFSWRCSMLFSLPTPSCPLSVHFIVTSPCHMHLCAYTCGTALVTFVLGFGSDIHRIFDPICHARRVSSEHTIKLHIS